MESSRRVHNYSVVGTRPSAVAKVMSGTRIGRWREDLLPRTHIMAERRVAKDSRHLSQPITVEYGYLFQYGLAAFSTTLVRLQPY